MKIKNTSIRITFLLTPFLISPIIYVQNNDILREMLLFYKFIVTFYIISNQVVKKRKISINASIYLIVCGICIGSALFNNGDFIQIIKELCTVITIFLIFEKYFNKGKGKEVLSIMTCILFIELSINLILMILFPQGLYKTVSLYGQEATYSFLGLDNQITPIYIVSETLLILKLYRQNFKWNYVNIFMCIILSLNILLTMSSTGILGCALIPIILLGKKFYKFINVKTISIVVIIIFMIFVVLRIQNIFSFIIEGIFKKDLTLTNRSVIWDRAILMIKNKPILGYGCSTLASIVKDRNAHNLYLQLVLQSGFIGFTFWIVLFKHMVSNCWRLRTLYVSKIISVCLMSYLICCISEVYNQLWLFILLILAYYIREINDIVLRDSYNYK